MCLSTSRYSQYSPLLHVTHLLLATNIWPGVFAQNIWPGIFAKWFVQFPISWFYRTMFMTLLILLLFLWNHIRFLVWQILTHFADSWPWLHPSPRLLHERLLECESCFFYCTMASKWNKIICENWPNDKYLLFAPGSKASKQIFFSRVKMPYFTKSCLEKWHTWK